MQKNPIDIEETESGVGSKIARPKFAIGEKLEEVKTASKAQRPSETDDELTGSLSPFQTADEQSKAKAA